MPTQREEFLWWVVRDPQDEALRKRLDSVRRETHDYPLRLVGKQPAAVGIQAKDHLPRKERLPTLVPWCLGTRKRGCSGSARVRRHVTTRQVWSCYVAASKVKCAQSRESYPVEANRSK